MGRFALGVYLNVARILRYAYTYDMCGDWGRLYDKELELSMEAMPGTYPSAHIEEIQE